MTTFLTNRDIHTSVICGIIPQASVRLFKFCMGDELLSDVLFGWHRNCIGTKFAKQNAETTKGVAK